MILIDSDILIDVSRRHPAAVEWMARVRDEDLVLPGFCALELVQGCRNRAELEAAEELIEEFAIVWPDAESLTLAYNAFKSIHLANAIGILDVAIAVTAICFNTPLHTFNQKHFAPVPGLTTVRPYVR